MATGGVLTGSQVEKQDHLLKSMRRRVTNMNI
jgi:hypothetical protein